MADTDAHARKGAFEGWTPPPPVLTIGITGKGPGTGKDALANFIAAEVQTLGYTVRRLAFADPLREVLAALTGLTPHACSTRAGKATMYAEGITVGRLHQLVGEGLRKILGGDVWVNAADRALAPRDVAVYGDVRYDDEADYVRARSGVVVAVVPPADDAGGAHAARGAEALAGRDPGHVSERGLTLAPDASYVNDGDLAAMGVWARGFVAGLFAER